MTIGVKIKPAPFMKQEGIPDGFDMEIVNLTKEEYEKVITLLKTFRLVSIAPPKEGV